MFFERRHKLSNSLYSEFVFLIICLSLRIIYCCSSSFFSSSIIFSVCLFVLLFPYSLAQNDVMIETKSCIRSSFSLVCGFTTSIFLSSSANTSSYRHSYSFEYRQWSYYDLAVSFVTSSINFVASFLAFSSFSLLSMIDRYSTISFTILFI